MALHPKFAVYRNLNNGQLSIKSLSTNLVIGHCQSIALSGVVFKVSTKGIDKIRKTKRKSVVAMVAGNIATIEGFIAYKDRSHGPYLITSIPELPEKISFDPYRWDGFVDKRGITLSTKNYIQIFKNGDMFASSK